MANEKIAMGINLRQNKNSNTSAYGKYYPEVDQQKTLSLRGFAKHLTDHGSRWGRDEVEGVLMKITECLPELVAQGVPVQLGTHGRGSEEWRREGHSRHGRSEPERHREGDPHPIPARCHEARQPLRPAVQGPLYAGTSKHCGHHRGDRQWKEEEGADVEADCYGSGGVEGAERPRRSERQ